MTHPVLYTTLIRENIHLISDLALINLIEEIAQELANRKITKEPTE